MLSKSLIMGFIFFFILQFVIVGNCDIIFVILGGGNFNLRRYIIDSGSFLFIICVWSWGKLLNLIFLRIGDVKEFLKQYKFFFFGFIDGVFGKYINIFISFFLCCVLSVFKKGNKDFLIFDFVIVFFVKDVNIRLSQ